MASTRKSKAVRRKLIAFDDETWQALDLLARDSMATWQELADEAFRDLLKKHGRPTDLRAALKQSMKQAAPSGAEPGKKPRKKVGKTGGAERHPALPFPPMLIGKGKGRT